MTPDAGMAPEDVRGPRWQILQEDLVHWLERWVHPPLDPAEIASEVVLRGLRGPTLHLLPRPKLWSWAKKTARNYTTDVLRSRRLHPCLLTGDLDDRAEAERGVTADCSPQAWGLAEELRRLATGLRGQVLEALAAEDVSNVEMAARFGCSRRAVEQARQWLREVANELRGQVGSPR